MAMVLKVVNASNDMVLIVWIKFLVQLSTSQKPQVRVSPSLKHEAERVFTFSSDLSGRFSSSKIAEPSAPPLTDDSNCKISQSLSLLVLHSKIHPSLQLQPKTLIPPNDKEKRQRSSSFHSKRTVRN